MTTNDSILPFRHKCISTVRQYCQTNTNKVIFFTSHYSSEQHLPLPIILFYMWHRVCFAQRIVLFVLGACNYWNSTGSPTNDGDWVKDCNVIIFYLFHITITYQWHYKIHLLSQNCSKGEPLIHSFGFLLMLLRLLTSRYFFLNRIAFGVTFT